MTRRSPARIPMAVRFERKVDRSGGPDACHIWKGAVSQWGLPRMMGLTKNVGYQGRRFAWELAFGVIPENRWIASTCAEKRCVNPAHLVLRAHHDDAERFWENVAVGPGCWKWIGSFDTTGYGQFKVMRLRKPVRAPRFVWELLHGPIPSAKWFVCHKCDTPACVRPDHLFLGTAKDNNVDMWNKGRGSKGEKHAAIMREVRERKLAGGT